MSLEELQCIPRTLPLHKDKERAGTTSCCSGLLAWGHAAQVREALGSESRNVIHHGWFNDAGVGGGGGLEDKTYEYINEYVYLYICICMYMCVCVCECVHGSFLHSHATTPPPLPAPPNTLKQPALRSLRSPKPS